MPLGVESLEREGVGDFLIGRAKNRKKLHALLKNLGEVSEEVALERAMHADTFTELGDLDELMGLMGWGAFAWGEGGRIWLLGIVGLWAVGLWSASVGFIVCAMRGRFSCGVFWGVSVGVGFGLGFVGVWVLACGFLSFGGGCVFACLGAHLLGLVRICLVWRRRWGARI